MRELARERKREGERDRSRAREKDIEYNKTCRENERASERYRVA